MNELEILRIIEHYATQYSVDPHWMRAIVYQESGNNPYALRFEPTYRYLYQPEHYTSPVNGLHTEMITQRMSWGLAQIMGALAREQGHTGFMGELLNPETNITHLAIRIRDLKKISTFPPDVFAMYNCGPGAIHKTSGKYQNQSYVDAIQTYLQNIHS
jgi:soluble lytic murein transglycosylase-like protein